MEKNNKDKYSLIKNELKNNKVLKTGVYIAAGLGALYLLGHLFKIIAHTTNGYNEMKAAFKANPSLPPVKLA